MFEENSIVYLNGEFKKLSDSKISPMCHSLHYGSGVFEGIRAYKIKNGTGVFKLREHVDRLFYSAEKIGLEISETREELEKIILEILKKNNLESAYIRPLVFFEGSSLEPTTTSNKTSILIAAWELGKYLPDSVTAKISDFRRISEKSTICDAKISGHYVNSLLATTKARKDGFDEAILLDHKGDIAEGSGENIFFVKGKKIYTPKLGKILNGITRRLVMEIAINLNYEIIEKNILPEDLKNFEGAFFTGTAVEVTPISKIENESGEEIIFDIKSGEDVKIKFLEIVSEKNEDPENYFTLI